MGLVHFVTMEGAATAENMGRWNSGSVEIGGIDATPLAPNFNAKASIRRIEDLLLFGLTASPHQVKIPPRARTNAGALRLRFQRSGTSMIFRDGTEQQISAGQWVLLDPTRPHVIVNEVEASHIFLEIPRNRLTEREIAAARSCRALFPNSGRISGMLFECARMSLEELGETSGSIERDLGHSLVDMFRMALREVSRLQEHRSSRDLIQQRVRDHIRRRLHDPMLSVESIAQAIGCSPRYVHKAFEGQETVSRLIWTQRLERCRDVLVDPAERNRSLTEIAFDHGFSSSAHFSRKFREQFGQSPSEYRYSVQPQLSQLSH